MKPVLKTFLKRSFHLFLGALFALWIAYRSIEYTGIHLPIKMMCLAVAASVVFLSGADLLQGRRQWKWSWWPYPLYLLAGALTSSLFYSRGPDCFQFLEPKIDIVNVLPQGPPESWGQVKLLLNEDCRRGRYISVGDLVNLELKVPKQARLIFSAGIIHGGQGLWTPELRVTAQQRNHPPQRILEAKLAGERHQWFDFSLDLSEWAQENVVITLMIAPPALETEPAAKPYVFLSSPRVLASDPEKSRPNVILVVVDSLRYDAVSRQDGAGHTPLLYQRMKKKGVDFQSHYANSSWTCTSMASLLTSTMPSQVGVVSYDQLYLPENAESVMELVQNAGYQTAGFTTNGLIQGRFNYDQGMDRLCLVGKNIMGWSLSGQRLNQETTRWLEKRQDLPFVLYLHYMDPHYPYLPPLAWHLKAGWRLGPLKYVSSIPQLLISFRPPKMYKYEHRVEVYRTMYRLDVEYWDQCFDELMKKLEELGLDQNTVVILVADHGEEFLDHGNLVHGTSLYNELIHVPLVIFPAGDARPAAIENLTSNLDLAPTVLELLEIPKPGGMLGRSLIKYCQSGGRSFQSLIFPDDHQAVFSELPITQQMMLTREVKLRYMQACITRDFKLIENGPHQDKITVQEFYDLGTDPREKNNLPLPWTLEGETLMAATRDFFGHLPGRIQIPGPPKIISPEGLKEFFSPEALKALQALGYIDTPR